MASDASGIHPPARRDEVERKAARVAHLAREAGLGGIVLSAQHNFAWLTAGRSSRIDATREVGSASLLVTAGGRRFVLANAIEAPRMTGETLDGLGFDLLDYPWTTERAAPATAFERAAEVAGSQPLGADTATAVARMVEGQLATLRCRFDEGEVPRYRALGTACGRIVGEVARAARPGMRELDVAHVTASALAAQDIRPTVLLVGGDTRIHRYRHPVATNARWQHRLLIVVCAEREGLVVALSRMVAIDADKELQRRTHAAAGVYAALLAATVAGAIGRDLFAAAATAYATAGFAGEEQRHHQGGAIAYRSREWVAHPASTDIVTPPQAFAWNPSIAGAKVEETVVLDADGQLDVVTQTPGWPTIEVEVRGRRIAAPGVLTSEA